MFGPILGKIMLMFKFKHTVKIGASADFEAKQGK